MGAEVLNLIFGILTNICAKLNICASNSPTSASPKTLAARQIQTIYNDHDY